MTLTLKFTIVKETKVSLFQFYRKYNSQQPKSIVKHMQTIRYMINLSYLY